MIVSLQPNDQTPFYRFIGLNVYRCGFLYRDGHGACSCYLAGGSNCNPDCFIHLHNCQIVDIVGTQNSGNLARAPNFI